MPAQRQVTQLLTRLPHSAAWPHFLLLHGCAKGLELLADGDNPPPIMGIIPAVETGALILESSCDDGSGH